MYSVELPLVSGNFVTLFFAANLAVCKTNNGLCTVMDGLHNNGGWVINAPYATVITLIKQAMMEQAL